MSLFTISQKISSGLALSFVSIIVASQGAFASTLITNSPTNSPLLIAYDNYCPDDELQAEDEVVVDGETYELVGNNDDLFIEYDLVDDDGNPVGDGTISVTEFSTDCETVTFEHIEGLDYEIVGDDVDN
jgi:hypothetical protein